MLRRQSHDVGTETLMISSDMSEEDKKRAAKALAETARRTAEAKAQKADAETAVLRTGKGLTDG